MYNTDVQYKHKYCPVLLLILYYNTKQYLITIPNNTLYYIGFGNCLVLVTTLYVGYAAAIVCAAARLYVVCAGAVSAAAIAAGVSFHAMLCPVRTRAAVHS